MLNFSDGVSIDTSGEYRAIKLHDGWYVTGNGLLVAVDSEEEADELLTELLGL